MVAFRMGYPWELVSPALRSSIESLHPLAQQINLTRMSDASRSLTAPPTVDGALALEDSKLEAVEDPETCESSVGITSASPSPPSKGSRKKRDVVVLEEPESQPVITRLPPLKFPERFGEPAGKRAKKTQKAVVDPPVVANLASESALATVQHQDSPTPSDSETEGAHKGDAIGSVASVVDAGATLPKQTVVDHAYILAQLG